MTFSGHAIFVENRVCERKTPLEIVYLPANVLQPALTETEPFSNRIVIGLPAASLIDLPFTVTEVEMKVNDCKSFDTAQRALPYIGFDDSASADAGFTKGASMANNKASTSVIAD